MGDVLTFTPRPVVAAPAEPAPMTEAEIRTRLGEALQTALDAADHIIAVLDHMEGDVDAENGGDAEPSIAAPGSQVVWLRNNDSGSEVETPETMPEALAMIPIAPLPWRGSGNVVAAAGVALLNMVGGR